MKVILPPMTANQKKAAKKEINRQLIEQQDAYQKDYDAMVLYTLYHVYGFGKKRLVRFLSSAMKEQKRLREFYLMEAEADGWLYRRKLKQSVMDIDELYRLAEEQIKLEGEQT